MKYNNIVKAVFLQRLNRFVARVLVDGEEILCHVKNTGRCRELLKEGVTVYLEKSDNPSRKYQYSLITVDKGGRLVNMDSQAPNKAVYEFLSSGGFKKGIELIKPECTHGKSRFDFYIEYQGRRAFIEVKGVTLENENVVSFPDAPTQRGTRHVRELSALVEQGYECYIIFVVQMKDVAYFTPNRDHDPDFSKALKQAYEKGVEIHAFDCFISENEMRICNKVEIVLD